MSRFGSLLSPVSVLSDCLFLCSHPCLSLPAFYTAAPLTSAGILPVMQSLCPDGQRDEYGFLQYTNSTVTQLLDRLTEVVENSNLFDTDRPGLEEELESLKNHLESLSSDHSSLENHFHRQSGFTLDSVVKKQDRLPGIPPIQSLLAQ